MTEETKEFIKAWNLRIDCITNDGLEGIFEMFSSLYILYNRLYNESFQILQDEDKLVKSRYSDHEKASILVIEYLTAESIVNYLSRSDNLADIEIISDLIEKNDFNINLENGRANPKLDLQLMKNLRSENDIILSKAILMTIYNVRSNMVHGEKHFKEHQRILLEPLIRILRTIIQLQIVSMK